MGACRFLHWLPPDDGTGKYSFTKKHRMCTNNLRNIDIFLYIFLHIFLYIFCFFNVIVYFCVIFIINK